MVREECQVYLVVTYYFILMVKQFKWYPAEDVERQVRTKKAKAPKLR